MAKVASARRYSFFAYYYGRRSGRVLKPHHVRDGLAFTELEKELLRRGFEPGETILNYPPPSEVLAACRSEDRLPPLREVKPLSPRDLLVVPTRPPADDEVHDDKVHQQRGYTTLEREVFAIFDRFVDVCSRSHLRLQPPVVERLLPGYENRADVTVRQTGPEAWYRELKRLDGTERRCFNNKHERRTPAYLLYLDETEELGGAGALVAFGMGGTETLGWAYRLRTDFAHLLDRPNFTMVEMATSRPERPSGIAFAADWKIDTALHIPL